MDRPPRRPLLIPLLLVVCIVGSLGVGVPFAMLGAIGLLGLLADGAYAVSLRAGLWYLCIPIPIWTVTYYLYLHCNGRSPRRFSMGEMLIAFTAAAIVFAIVAALLRANPL